MRNKLVDLNNHLFEQIERLNDDELTGEDLDREIKRSEALTKVAQTIINNGALAISVQKHRYTYGTSTTQLPEFLQLENKNSNEND